MGKMPGVVFCCLFVLLAFAGAEEGDSPSRFSLAVNPLKFALGIINAEAEYSFTPAFSVHVFTEVLVLEHAYTRERHPGWVVRTGPRWELHRVSSSVTLYGGLTGGYARWVENRGLRDLTVGAEAGARLQLGRSWYLLPKAILTVPFSSDEPVRGVEALAGFSF